MQFFSQCLFFAIVAPRALVEIKPTKTSSCFSTTKPKYVNKSKNMSERERKKEIELERERDREIERLESEKEMRRTRAAR